MLKAEVFNSNTILDHVYAPTIHHVLPYVERTGLKFFLWNGVVYEATDEYTAYEFTGLNVNDLQ